MQTFTSIHAYHISLLSSALRMRVLKNQICSTKLSTLMSAEPISTCHLRSSDERSKHTFVDRMHIVPRCKILSAIVMVVADNVAREFPVVSRICGPCPIFINLILAADQTTPPTRISCQNPRTDNHGIFTPQTAVGVISCLDRSAQQLPWS